MSTKQVTEATIEDWVLHAFTLNGETSYYRPVTTTKLARGAEIMRTLLAERDEAQRQLASALLTQRAELVAEVVRAEDRRDAVCDIIVKAENALLPHANDTETEWTQTLHRVLDERHALHAERDALKAEVERLRADQNTVARRELSEAYDSCPGPEHSNHWDAMMTHGANCPACNRQREWRKRMRDRIEALQQTQQEKSDG